jgi:CubicO group peptidase (beta-lactamase class C family)
MTSKVTGKFYGDFIQERIFEPLGMNTARIISEADIVPNRAAGYRLVVGELKNQEWVSPALNTAPGKSFHIRALHVEVAVAIRRIAILAPDRPPIDVLVEVARKIESRKVGDCTADLRIRS